MSTIESRRGIAQQQVRDEVIGEWPAHPLLNRGPLTLLVRRYAIDQIVKSKSTEVNEIHQKLNQEYLQNQQIGSVLSAADEFMRNRKRIFISERTETRFGIAENITTNLKLLNPGELDIVIYRVDQRIQANGPDGLEITNALRKLFARMRRESDFRIDPEAGDKIRGYIDPYNDNLWNPKNVDKSWHRHTNPILRVLCSRNENTQLLLGTDFNPRSGWTASLSFIQSSTPELIKERSKFGKKRALSTIESWLGGSDFVSTQMESDRNHNPKSKQNPLFLNIRADYSEKIDGRTLTPKLKQLGYKRITDRKTLDKYKSTEELKNPRGLLLYAPIDTDDNNHLLEIYTHGEPNSKDYFLDIVGHHTKNKKARK